MTSEPTASFPQFKTEAGRARYLAAYDAALADWPVAYEERDMPTRLGPTHVIVSGPPDAPALVLLHSFAGSATVWRPNVEALSRHFCTYAVDVIGQPGKSLAIRRLRNRRDYSAWFTDLLDGLDVARTSIVGCSFGGFLALSQAALTPDRVDRVVLISPAGSFVGLSLRFRVLMMTGPLRRRIRRLLGDKRPPDIAEFSGRRVQLHPEDANWRALMSVTISESATVSVTEAPVFSRGELRRVRSPTLLLIGDAERLYEPHATLALAKQRMPQIETAIVPDADHVAAMAQPDDVNERILRFLGAALPVA